MAQWNFALLPTNQPPRPIQPQGRYLQQLPDRKVDGDGGWKEGRKINSIVLPGVDTVKALQIEFSPSAPSWSSKQTRQQWGEEVRGWKSHTPWWEGEYFPTTFVTVALDPLQ